MAGVTCYPSAMSERWGFDLSMEAVRLLRHDDAEWQEFAVQKLDGDNIEALLAGLVAKVEKATAVDIFLPRDQILYTDVKVTDDATAPDEVRAAMEGRTPYALDELEIDWVSTGPGTARVAAIARETLDEAEAFVIQGGLTVRAFSSLASQDDFPRPPVFSEITKTPEAAAKTAAFTTARTVSTPPPAPDPTVPVQTVKTDGPVVKVDDATPVLQLPKSVLPPLNPGAPLPRPTSQPRVVTNIGAAAAEARAASLNAPQSISIRQHDRAIPAPALVAIAALLSVGIAIIIWSIVPSTPETSLVAPDAITAPVDAQTDIVQAAPAPPDDTTPLPSPLPLGVADVTDTPAIPALAETPPVFATSPIAPLLLRARPAAPITASALTADAAPAIVWLEPRPERLGDIESYTPVALLAGPGDILESPDFAIVAAFRPVESLVTVASLGALPDRLADPAPRIETDAPSVFETPVAPIEDTEIAALDPLVEESISAPPLAEIVEPIEPPQAPDETAALEAVIENDLPAAVPVEAEDIPDIPLVPTELAAALPQTAPRARPGGFITEIERQNFGGRTREELAEIRPGTRPQSAQIEALVARVGTPPSDLAVTTSLSPRTKPQGFDTIVAAGLRQLAREREARALAAATPDTSGAIEAALADDVAAEEASRPQNSPRLAIPSNASVARQATVEDVLSLNRINLVGVFGRASDRRALVRLPNGRYIKVQVGDRVDGGTVAAISETALQYQKGGRTISLAMPQG